MVKKSIEQVALEDGRYDAKALLFVHEGLGRTIQDIRSGQITEPEQRHISGAELSIGLASLAIEQWGRLARTVFNKWSVRGTRDFGEIVYLMIANSWMSGQENDAIEDFDDVFDFEEMFEKNFVFNINPKP
jgi:uncharacterized repeat protein (TIGR04138 family)